MFFCGIFCGIGRAMKLDDGGNAMTTAKFVYWQEGDAWIGYLDDYPDYWIQGVSLEDLKDHLRELYDDLTSGASMAYATYAVITPRKSPEDFGELRERYQAYRAERAKRVLDTSVAAEDDR